MKILQALLLLVLCTGLLSGCSWIGNPVENTPTLEAGTPCPVGEYMPQPALYGLWAKEEVGSKGSILELMTISEKSVYLVETTGEKGNGSLRETYFEIQDVDWVNGVVTMSTKWIRHDGKGVGFDYPLRYMKVYIDNDTLFYSLKDEGQGIPVDATNGPWERK
jgi:hypothetical protein